MDKDNIWENLVRVGTVTVVDATKRLARVKFQDTGITSGWLYVLQHSGAGVTVKQDGEHTHSIYVSEGSGSASTAPAHKHEGSTLAYWMPKVNDTVLCLYIAAFNADGFILGGV